MGTDASGKDDPTDVDTTTYAWLKTKYTYSTATSDGVYLLEYKIDPEGNYTRIDYDSNYYKSKVGIGNITAQTAVERHYHDNAGREVLKADTNGLVTKNDYDGYGHVYRVQTYQYADAIKPATTFTPARYDSFTALTTTLYTYSQDIGDSPVYERTIPQGKSASDVIAKRTVYDYLSGKVKYTIFDDSSSSTDSYLYYYYNALGQMESEVKAERNSYGEDQPFWFTDHFYDSQGREFATLWWDYNEEEYRIRAFIALFPSVYPGILLINMSLSTGKCWLHGCRDL